MNNMACERGLKSVLVLLLSALSSQLGAACRDDNNARLLFERLAGEWHGDAVTTPVGPRPYDIDFQRRGKTWIYGNANPGAAIHHWGFYCEDGELWLRFLSTFRGNRDPILLKAVEITESDVLFEASDPDFLDVRVQSGEKRSQLEVLHHDERHVLIRLKRTGS